MEIFNFIKWRGPILLAVIIFTVFALATDIKAQTSAQDIGTALRVRLAEVKSKQEGFAARLKDLDEESKPENIEKSLTRTGSLHPEDLREARRRQLELEKINIRTQVSLLAETQTKVEADIVRADAAAYNQSAVINPVSSQQPSAEQPSVKAATVQRPVQRSNRRPRRRQVRRRT